MDYKDLIESGKLELYALGALTDEEIREVEEALMASPDLQEEYSSIADALTEYGKVDSEMPPLSILEKAKSEIEDLEPINTASPENVVPIQVSDNIKPRSNYSWIAMAASLLLIASVGLNIKLSSDLSEVQADYLALESEKDLMATNTVKLQDQKDYLASIVDHVASGDVLKTTMQSTPNFNGYESTVFWDKTSAKVVLSAKSLPTLKEGEQYQLWAIVDGAPVDAGLFTSEDDLLEMKPINGDAVAFAVTIEPVGGSVNPTMEKMCMLGNVSQS